MLRVCQPGGHTAMQFHAIQPHLNAPILGPWKAPQLVPYAPTRVMFRSQGSLPGDGDLSWHAPWPAQLTRCRPTHQAKQLSATCRLVCINMRTFTACALYAGTFRYPSSPNHGRRPHCQRHHTPRPHAVPSKQMCAWRCCCCFHPIGVALGSEELVDFLRRPHTFPPCFWKHHKHLARHAE